MRNNDIGGTITIPRTHYIVNLFMLFLYRVHIYLKKDTKTITLSSGHFAMP